MKRGGSRREYREVAYVRVQDEVRSSPTPLGLLTDGERVSGMTVTTTANSSDDGCCRQAA
jgi:hypothetical protein